MNFIVRTRHCWAIVTNSLIKCNVRVYIDEIRWPLPERTSIVYVVGMDRWTEFEDALEFNQFFYNAWSKVTKLQKFSITSIRSNHQRAMTSINLLVLRFSHGCTFTAFTTSFIIGLPFPRCLFLSRWSFYIIRFPSFW